MPTEYDDQYASVKTSLGPSRSPVRKCLLKRVENRTNSDIAEILNWLREMQLPIFEGMKSTQLKRIASYVMIEEYGKGQTILKQGKSGDRLFILAAGSVDFYVFNEEDAKARDEERRKHAEEKERSRLRADAPQSTKRRAAAAAAAKSRRKGSVYRAEEEIPTMNSDEHTDQDTTSEEESEDAKETSINGLDEDADENVAFSNSMGRWVNNKTVTAEKAWFGEVSLAKGPKTPASASAVAKSDCILVTMHRGYFMEVLKTWMDSKGAVSDPAHAARFANEHFLFSRFDKAQQDNISYSFIERKFTRGEAIIRQGHPSSSVFFVVEGQCAVKTLVHVDMPSRFLSSLGKSQSLDVMQQIHYLQQQTQHNHKNKLKFEIELANIGPGGYFGERPLLKHTNEHEITVTAQTKVVVYELAREHMLRNFRGSHVARMKHIDEKKMLLVQKLINLKLRQKPACSKGIGRLRSGVLSFWDSDEADEPLGQPLGAVKPKFIDTPNGRLPLYGNEKAIPRKGHGISSLRWTPEAKEAEIFKRQRVANFSSSLSSAATVASAVIPMSHLKGSLRRMPKNSGAKSARKPKKPAAKPASASRAVRTAVAPMTARNLKSESTSSSSSAIPTSRRKLFALHNSFLGDKHGNAIRLQKSGTKSDQLQMSPYTLNNIATKRTPQNSEKMAQELNTFAKHIDGFAAHKKRKRGAHARQTDLARDMMKQDLSIRQELPKGRKRLTPFEVYKIKHLSELNLMRGRAQQESIPGGAGLRMFRRFHGLIE